MRALKLTIGVLSAFALFATIARGEDFKLPQTAVVPLRMPSSEMVPIKAKGRAHQYGPRTKCHAVQSTCPVTGKTTFSSFVCQ